MAAASEQVNRSPRMDGSSATAASVRAPRSPSTLGGGRALRTGRDLDRNVEPTVAQIAEQVTRRLKESQAPPRR
jgi:hypothetical protein